MTTPILTTKFYIPPPHPDHVFRPRLTERLNEGLHRKLTLISAPAGFGKTTLISHWIDRLRMTNDELQVEPEQVVTRRSPLIARHSSLVTPKFAWLSLDDADNDPARFLTYFIAALQTIEANVGKGILNVLQSPQPPSIESILTALINEISEIPGHFALVLDDYHVIEAPPIDNALTFLLDHLPPQIHLIVVSRTDPSLPLPRLRAQSQMSELRADDLRFTLDEVAIFLDEVMNLKLSSENVAALETRTEGWIAGLQLAALSMKGRDAEPITNFINSFSGSNRYIIDYLADEVLQQRPKGTRGFLLQTSILDRLSSSLCDVVTERKDSQAILETLEAANLFIVPLDDERCWYRYHHLFADLLRQRLRREQPQRISALHRRASEWYEQNGLVKEAVRHALAAEDFKRAARLIEELADILWERGEPTTLLRWLEALPDEYVSSRPSLCTFYAWVLFLNGQNQAAELRLQAAERALGLAADGPIEISPEDPGHLNELDKLEQQGRVAAIRASIAFRQGDGPGIFQFSHQALEYLSKKSLMWRCITAMALGFAQDFSGDTAAASRTLSEAVAMSKASGNIYLILSAGLHLGTILMLQGRLKQVYRLCQELLQLAKARGVLHTEMAGCLYDELGLVLCEWNDLDEAMHHLKKGSELSERAYDVGVLGWSYLTMLRALYTQGDVAGAEAIIQKMDKLEWESDVPPWYISPKEAWKARLWLRQGDLDAVSQWAQDRGLRVGGELPYLREEEYMMLARILVAQDRLEEALELLQRLLKEAEAGDRIARVAEILMIQALARQAQGENEEALIALERALSLAEPGGYVRTFVDEGQPMARLLYKAAARGIAPDYTRRLLTAFPDFRFANSDFGLTSSAEASPQSKIQNLKSEIIEPLSERELEVLQLIAKGLTNQEVAIRLFLSLNTVKAHTHNIYGKLGVNSRTQAVAKARSLAILPPSKNL